MLESYSYIAYNLGIKSSIKLPKLIASQKTHEVKIITNSIDNFPSGEIVLDQPNSLSLIRFSNKDVGVLFENKPFLRIRNGREILINSDLDIDTNLFNSLILNQGMGILLYQRGYLVFHGSAVNMYDEAVAFVGASGKGKSTIAATLNIKGYPLISDDVLAIKFENNNPLILPSFPIIKLREDVIKILATKIETYSKIYQKSQKYSYSPDNNFCTYPLPIKSIYLLQKSKENKIFSLKVNDALVELIKQSYAMRLFDNKEKSQNLFQCSNVVKNVPIKCLKRSNSLKNYEDLLSKIEDDIAQKEI